MDGRRRQYVPLDVYVAFRRTGTKLFEKWGMEGLCVWMLLLAASKREITQGTFTFSSDEEAWAKLGATTTLFTIDDFFKRTGELKQTRRTRVGRVSNVSLTRWGDWNNTWKTQKDTERRQHGREENPRSEGTITAALWRQSSGITATELDLEVERELGAVVSIARGRKAA